MEWFILALLACFCFAGANITDKFILTKKIKDPVSYILISFLPNIIPIAAVFIFFKVVFNFSSLIALLDGAACTGLFMLYSKALIKEDTSKIVSLIYVKPIFTTILAVLFLKESLNLPKYIGIALLVASAFLVSYKKEKGKFKFSEAVKLIILYAICSSILNIIVKYALFNIDYWSFFFWVMTGNLLGVLTFIIIPKIRKDMFSQLPKISFNTWKAILLTDSFGWAGSILAYFAISLGPIALYASVMSAQPFIVFILMLILTVHRPKILKEEISRTSLLFKSAAAVLIFIGSYLILTV